MLYQTELNQTVLLGGNLAYLNLNLKIKCQCYLNWKLKPLFLTEKMTEGKKEEPGEKGR